MVRLDSDIQAEEDWLLARSALRRKSPLIYGTTFHAQQCAEKCLRADLMSRRHSFPRTYDLIALHDLCVGQGIRVPVDPDKLERLAAEEPTLDEAWEALQIAQAVAKDPVYRP